MSMSFTETMIAEMSRLFDPLRRLEDPAFLTMFARELGWSFAANAEFEVDVEPLVDVVNLLVDTAGEMAAADSEDDRREITNQLIEQLPEVIISLFDFFPALEDAIRSTPDFVDDIGNLGTELPRRLLDLLVYEFLRTYHPKAFAIFRLLGILDTADGGCGLWIRVVVWDRIPKLFTDPLDVANEVYQWTGEFDGREFLSRLEDLMGAILVPGGIYRQTATIRDTFNREVPFDHEIRLPIFQGGQWPDSFIEFDLNLAHLPADQYGNAGLLVYPYIHGGFQIEDELADVWKIVVRGNTDLNTGLGIELRAPHSLALRSDLFSDNPLAVVDGRLEVSVRKTAFSERLNYIFGSQESSHLAYREMGFNLLFALDAGREELAAEFEVVDLTLAVTSDQADGFLQKILSGINIHTSCDLVIGYSNLDGIYFRGSGGLEIEIPIHESLGPITIDSIYIGVAIDGGFNITLAASFGVEIGPLSGSVQKIGLLIPMSFPDDRRGNLGPLQIEAPRFKPPTGAGLAVDASGIIGGGFLEFDDTNKRYAGILALNFGEIGLVAISLITTRMPDGSEGFSLLINIGVTFDPPIQLSMGFTLSGVGGLIGVNRSMEVEVLQAGIRNRTLDSILFPDPSTVIANANKIISDLRSVFPPNEGRFVVGPMVKIGYGSPNIITADIGIFIELPDPVRIVLMGQVEALLPKPDDPILTIHLDVLGVLDFEKQELTFQAALYDSSVLSFAIFGDSAFLLGWGDDPRFALSLGGFHPKFTPPPPPIIFGGLRRLSIALASGGRFQLSCGAYQALTPNTLQFGARADLYASEGGASITGFMSFDALIYFSPFSFEAQIGAGVKVKYQGHSLADVNLSFTLSGPTPWDARGTATIEVLKLDVDVGFHKQWGRSDRATLPPVDPWQPLMDALESVGSWGSILPEERTLVEAVRERDDGDTTQIVIHPAGRFEVRQNIVPLGIVLEKVGNSPIKDHDRFDIENLHVGGEVLGTEPVEEFFARGQFERLSDNQKLSVPSFEKMKGGVVASPSSAIRVDGDPEPQPLEYESLLLNADRTVERQTAHGELPWRDGKVVCQASVAKRAIKRAGHRKRFSSLRTQPRVGYVEDRYCVATTSDMRRAALDPEIGQDNRDMTRTAADQALEAHLENSPEDAGRLMVVLEHEVQEAL